MKAMLDVIKYEGDNKTFIFKHDCEDFNLGTQLIVHESQEAIFFLNGEALDLFGPGRYTLSTENIPLISKVINLPTGGETPFHAEVYFINKTEQLAIKWGTDNKVEYIDPNYNFPLSIGVSGEMGLKVADSRKLLNKLVGTEEILEQDKLISYFRGILMAKVKPYIARTMKEQKINIFEIDENLDIFSNSLKEKLLDDFLEYGLDLKKFLVTNVVKPEEESEYQKFKKLHFRRYTDIEEAKLEQEIGVINEETNARKMIIESNALAKKREQEGYTYQQEKSFEVAKEAAGNEGAGNFTSAGIGLGVMGSVGNSIGGVINDSFQNINKSNRVCNKCGKQVDSQDLFCKNCGNPLEVKCINCGTKLNNNDNFCPKCGKARN